MKNLQDAVNDAFVKASESVISQIITALKAEPHVTKVSVSNQTFTANFKAYIEFHYKGAFVKAWASSGWFSSNGHAHSSFRGDWARAIDIFFGSNHSTISSMITTAVHKQHQMFAQELCKRIEQTELPDHLKPRQRALMLQQLFIDGGFDATMKVLPSGELRLIIRHEDGKNFPMKEVVVK